MASEEKIVNKIVPIETIIEVANYLEDQKDEYTRLITMDIEKNKNLPYSQQVYKYKGIIPHIDYEIRFTDGREVTKPDYNWFINMLNNKSSIDHIAIFSHIDYKSNYKDNEHYEYMRLYTRIHFWENHVFISIDGKNTEEQVYKVHSYIKGVIENNEDRYNKTVKNRNLRIQAFSFSIGIILSYILYLILSMNMSTLPSALVSMLNNKLFLVIGQWLVAGLFGNILGYPIMMVLYKNIIPKTKYSHYNKSSHKSVYVDNIEDYISNDEVQIGKFANNDKDRMNIEKIYKITRIIVLIQLIISILLLIFL